MSDVPQLNPNSIRVRVAGLIFRGSEILVVEHGVGPERWSCFPGGGLELGESFEDGLRRELFEELELRCEIGNLAAVGSYCSSAEHSVEFYFRCVSNDERMNPRCPVTRTARFVDPRDLLELNVFPLELSVDIAKCGYEGLSSIRYYGQFH